MSKFSKHKFIKKTLLNIALLFVPFYTLLVIISIYIYTVMPIYTMPAISELTVKGMYDLCKEIENNKQEYNDGKYISFYKVGDKIITEINNDIYDKNERFKSFNPYKTYFILRDSNAGLFYKTEKIQGNVLLKLAYKYFYKNKYRTQKYVPYFYVDNISNCISYYKVTYHSTDNTALCIMYDKSENYILFNPFSAKIIRTNK